MLVRATAAISVVLVATVVSATAAGTVLYDGSLGSTPDQQGWVLLMDPQGGNAGLIHLEARAAAKEISNLF